MTFRDCLTWTESMLQLLILNAMCRPSTDWIKWSTLPQMNITFPNRTVKAIQHAKWGSEDPHASHLPHQEHQLGKLNTLWNDI